MSSPDHEAVLVAKALMGALQPWQITAAIKSGMLTPRAVRALRKALPKGEWVVRHRYGSKVARPELSIKIDSTS